MNTLIQKVLMALFSICAVILLIKLFPIVLCPLMWFLFIGGIALQIVATMALKNKSVILISRIVTAFIFLLIAYRIYFEYTNDFSINPEKSLSTKFIVFTVLYLVGSFLLLYAKNKIVDILTFVILVVAVAFMILIIRETHDKAAEEFKKENPDYVLLDNQETKYFLNRIKNEFSEYYDETTRMIYRTRKDSTSYNFVICDGKKEGTVPLVSIVRFNSDSTKSTKLLFRYEPELKYGYIWYMQILPDTIVFSDEHEIFDALDQELDLFYRTLKK